MSGTLLCCRVCLSSGIASDGLVTGLDVLDTASGAARVALEEIQPILLDQSGVRGLASLTSHIFRDISSKHTLNTFLLELTLDNQPLSAVNGT